jgi:glutaminyl-peptide cyclotransferase
MSQRGRRVPVWWLLAALMILVGAGLAVGWAVQRGSAASRAQIFDGERALADASYQMSLGPRVAGSTAHDKVVAWMQTELKAAGWQVEVQEAEMMGHPIKNVVAKRGAGSPWVILGAHYDSRMAADHDPDPNRRMNPVPGANDGASGVAVLLELARTLPTDLPKQVWLVFFDAEDNGDLPGWDWILGSRAFVARLTRHPDAAVVLDMVGDANLDIYQEKNSDPTLTSQIWDQAAKAGYSSKFISVPRFAMLDDHTPFLQVGIPAVDIIDFNYPYWHTTADTIDKISADSLQVVGRTLYNWLVMP